MKRKKVIHSVWEDTIKSKMPVIIGKWQYIFSSDRGEISMIELPNYFHDGVTLWEIYCFKGDLFEDIERYNTQYEAEKRCFELLG